MYRVVRGAGDAIEVPQLVFSRLQTAGGDDARFRVALYVVQQGEAEAQAVAKALHISQAKAESALQYWEGAGLVQRQQAEAAAVPITTARRRLTTREVTGACADSPTLETIVQEVQRLFGGVVSQADINIFATLYLSDEVPPDLILLCVSHCAAKKIFSARYVEKTLLAWRREGICDCAAADAYLKTLAERERREKKVAKLLGVEPESFSLAERRRIAAWFEEFGFGIPMLELARTVAGDKANEIRYLHGILNKWYGKGYKTPKDVQRSEANHNLRVQGQRKVAAGAMLGLDDYVPLKKQGGEA